MARSKQIIDTLKQELKVQGIHYRDLAAKLSLSESTIKHMFSTKNFSLQRLDKICDVLGMELSDLVEQFDARTPRLEQLTLENEKLLISDTYLLMVAYCVTNNWSVDDILRNYTISETECIRCLAQLDRMKMIELLPENRVRLIVSTNFQWHKNGPIETFFKSEAQKHFFNGAFDDEDSLHMVKLGGLSDKSIQQIIERLKNAGELYQELYQEDRKQSFEKRHGTSMVLAIRKWQFQAFRQFQR